MIAAAINIGQYQSIDKHHWSCRIIHCSIRPGTFILAHRIYFDLMLYCGECLSVQRQQHQSVDSLSRGVHKMRRVQSSASAWITQPSSELISVFYFTTESSEFFRNANEFKALPTSATSKSFLLGTREQNSWSLSSLKMCTAWTMTAEQASAPLLQNEPRRKKHPDENFLVHMKICQPRSAQTWISYIRWRWMRLLLARWLIQPIFSLVFMLSFWCWALGHWSELIYVLFNLRSNENWWHTADYKVAL